MDDTEFLAYCTGMTQTPRCGFVPAHLARLCTLAGKNEEAEVWASEPNHVVNCNPDWIRTLVDLASKVEPPQPDSGNLDDMLDAAYADMEGSKISRAYSIRHGIESLAVLTVTDDVTADLIASSLEDRIRGKVVVEIGGGIGLLAMHMGLVAKRVFCIEANPIWASSFVAVLLEHKPKNVSFLFGAAEEFAGLIKADVAIFCTHSGVDSMRKAASLFAPEVIDVYGEIIAAAPDKFDQTAIALRPFA
jgi:hypothetical protein